MNSLNRRQFIQICGSSLVLAALPLSSLKAAAGARIVVVGGGFAGATAAKFLRLLGGDLSVTLVDPAAEHVSCVGSNLVLTGETPIATLTKPLATLRDRYGVQLVSDRAVIIDPFTHQVRLASGGTLPYEHVILAPGIDFETVPGHDFNVMPHAWIAGAQTTLLKNQLLAMPNGGTFVISIPRTPFRAHTAPYERATVVADFFRRNRPASKVLILDANSDIAAMRRTFNAAFTGIYRNIVQYVPNVTVNSADAANRSLNITRNGVTSIVSGNVINLIPTQRAGKLLFDSGLVPSGSRFAPVNPLNYETTQVPGSNVHILGDSQATGQAKSGHMANSQAKVCVDAIIRALVGLPPDSAPKTTAAAFPPITRDTASWTTTTFEFDPATGTMRAVAGTPAEAPQPTEEIREEMSGWVTNLLSDSFT
ncbi:FAD-dependent oxidoreductase [Pseudomonas sp. TCU-HL1]|uniref:FAD-dependent oxidoreductase n=1 Tax=Pseudomonas sp. TCU-HL1 TaxID=1856685 RepID=UPI00083DFFF3|nr:FAD-dependent oxidoreductase [Pseudomonas sp. TCU-HL1]AOE85163.1 Sulfide dehydrogenase flavocytochrome C flavoprotein chain precursor [Pseudomonas sp. TCU-HL1]